MSRKNWIKTEYRFIYYIILWIIVLLFICELYLHKFLPGPYIAQTHGDPYLDAYLGFYDSSMKNIKFLPVTQGKKNFNCRRFFCL